MALDVEFLISISADRLTSTIEDTTVYGAPNADRADLRVFLTLYKNDVSGVGTTVALTSNEGDPQTDSEWSYTTPDDGWVTFYYAAFSEYSGGTTYSIYDAVFDPADDAVYRSKANSNTGHLLSDTAWWELITDPSGLAGNEGEANQSNNITSLIYRRVLTWNSQYAYGQLIGSNCLCTDCDDSEIIQPYNLLSLYVNGAIQADLNSEWLKGERICRAIQSEFIDNC